MDENIFFTVVSPVNGKETKIHFSYNDIGGQDGIPSVPIIMSIEQTHIRIDRQQLTELAALLLALAGNVDIDYSGADALLEGFSLKGKKAATLLAEALEE